MQRLGYVIVLLIWGFMLFGDNTPISKVINNPEEFVDKSVTLEGTVDHVCRHGGRKLTMSFSETTKTIKAAAPKEAGKFNTDINGKKISLTGFLRKFDLPKEDTAEEEHHEGGEEHSEGFVKTFKDGSKVMYYLESKKYKVLN